MNDELLFQLEILIVKIRRLEQRVEALEKKAKKDKK